MAVLMGYVLAFIGGCFCGCTLGVLVMGMLIAARLSKEGIRL